MWADVRRNAGGSAEALSAARWACPEGYAAAVRLASFILRGAAPEAGEAASGLGRPAGVQAYLLSVAGVWERALRRMCHEVGPGAGWSCVPDARRTRRWHDGPGVGDPVRWMTADVILESSRGRWVLDAKYKCDYAAEDRHDRFQVTAYALAFDAGHGTLVYPTAEGAGRFRLLLRTTEAGRRVTIDSLELPMRRPGGVPRDVANGNPDRWVAGRVVPGRKMSPRSGFLAREFLTRVSHASIPKALQ